MLSGGMHGGGHVWQGGAYIVGGGGMCGRGSMRGRGQKRRHCSRWYTYYWNTFLFIYISVLIVDLPPAAPLSCRLKMHSVQSCGADKVTKDQRCHSQKR